MMTRHGPRGKGSISNADPARGPVVVLGATGMLGHKLVQRLARTRRVVAGMRGRTPIPGLDRGADVRVVGGVEAENIASIERLLDDAQPAVVVNCIGIIKQ